MTKKIRLAIAGLGNVPLALLAYLKEKAVVDQLQKEGIEFSVTGVATASRGLAIAEEGINETALLALGKEGRLTELHRGPALESLQDFLKNVPADILLEAMPATENGEPAANTIGQALGQGIHVVTSNKSPVAWHYQRLQELAQKYDRRFRFGATVLAGNPPLFQFFEAISDPGIIEIQAVVNATSNQIMTLMLQEGASFEEGLKKAQAMGIAERDPSLDTSGHDTQYKMVILANALMGAVLKPSIVPTRGIENISLADLKEADHRGQWIHLLGIAKKEKGIVWAEVGPKGCGGILANVRGMAMGIYFKTALKGEFYIGLEKVTIRDTAAGVFEDLFLIAKNEGKNPHL